MAVMLSMEPLIYFLITGQKAKFTQTKVFCKVQRKAA